ncbi:unnamed protein product [Prorocentrum cordatum]|uniref:Integrase catalytic domain-containing protein n=2 Tax=Prorocentrum cordatum TaxID=2364126 RepID=A0ABN9URD5_9DINO|nr:unnamed protein product [Polarella glacialis]
MSEAGHALAPGGAEDANGLGEPEASQQTLSAMSIEDFGRLVKAMGSLATALDNQLQNGEVGARARGEIRRVRYMAIGGESSTACKGWPDYQLWKRKIFRWERATDVATEKRADRVLKQLDADLQRKLECITDEQLTNPEGVQHKHDDERRRTARECLFQYQKKPAESLTSFASWLDFQFDRIATHGLAMPDEWKALFLEEGAGLDDASLRLIRVLTTGDSSHAATPAAIRELDISKKETMTGTRRTRMTQPPGESELASQTSQTEAEDGLLSCDGASSLDTDTEYALLDVMEQKDFNEADAPIAPATTQADRRKTRRQNRELKRKLKTDRRYFQRSAPDREARLPLSEIIKRPRCSLRQQKGHGGDKCPNKDGPTASGARGGQRATSGARGSHQGPPLTGFSYPNGQEEVFLMGAQMPRSTKETALVASKSIDSCTQKELALQAAKGSCPGGLRVPAGAAVLDTAAGQGLVGKDNLAELSSHLGRLGYAAEHAAARRALAGGVVGKTGAPTTAPIPTGIEKAHGAFEVGAIEKGIPLFVTVFLLTALGAVVDLPKKRARLSKLNCTTELFSIPPGHPRFWIDRLKGPREFQRPGRLAQQLPELKADSFRQPVQSVGVYEVGNDDLGGGDPATIDDPTTDRHDDEQTRRTGKPEAEFAGKYVLTENLILERIPQSSRTWAFFTSTPMSTACTLSREPRNMLATNRLFTLKTRKVDCGPTKEQLICRHPAMEISSGANLHGRRWNCEARGQRTAHRTAGELRGAAMKRKRGIVFSFAIFEAIPEPKPARGENFAALMKAHIEQLNTLKAQQQNTDQMMLENRQAMERTMGVSQAQGPTIQSMDKSKWELIHDQEKPRAAAGPELDQEDPAIVDPTPEQVSSTQAKAQRFFFELEPVWSDTADGRRAFLFWRAGWAHAILGDTANDDFEVTIPKNMPEQTLASSKGDVENTETAGADIEDPAEKPIEISARIKEMIGRVHANLDHSRAEIFTHVPRAAQARPEVLQGVWGHVKCDAQRMTAEHRQAASPRTFQFSGIVAVDTFFVPFLSEVVPYLGAKVAWRATMETWIRYVGPPDALITDGGPEFQGEFEHGSEAKGAELPFQPEVRELIRDAQRHGSIKFGAHRSEKHQTKCAPAGPGAVSAFEPPDADEWKATFETKAPSTFGGEVLALSGTVAGAERFQTLFLDVTQGGLLTEHWRDKVGPFTAFLKHDRELNVAPLSNFNIVDAKGIFDTLSKETSGSKADRRIALDLSVIRSVMTRVGSQIRWVPHPAMPVDSLSKSDIQKGDWHLLCHFLVSLLQSTHFHVPYVIEMWGAGQAQGRPVRPRVFGAAGRAPMSGCPGFGPPLDSVTLRTGRGEGPPWSHPPPCFGPFWIQPRGCPWWSGGPRGRSGSVDPTVLNALAWGAGHSGLGAAGGAVGATRSSPAAGLSPVSQVAFQQAAAQAMAAATGQPLSSVTPAEKPVPFVLGILLTQESQLTLNGYPPDAPALVYDKSMSETFNIANVILPELVTNMTTDVVLNHDADWQNYPEVGKAVVAAGGEENCICVAICPSRGKWGVGLGGGWKTREAAAKLALSVALAQGHAKYQMICQAFPEFDKLCRGECSPQALPGSSRRGGNGAAPAPTTAYGPAPVTKWITLTEKSAITSEGYGHEAPVVLHSKDFQELFSSSHHMLTELIGNVAGNVKMTHDADWSIFPEVARATKAAGCEDQCMCIATCPDHSAWAVGLGSGWKTRETAAKIALCVALTMNAPQALATLVGWYPQFGAVCAQVGLHVKAQPRNSSDGPPEKKARSYSTPPRRPRFQVTPCSGATPGHALRFFENGYDIHSAEARRQCVHPPIQACPAHPLLPRRQRRRTGRRGEGMNGLVAACNVGILR